MMRVTLDDRGCSRESGRKKGECVNLQEVLRFAENIFPATKLSEVTKA